MGYDLFSNRVPRRTEKEIQRVIESIENKTDAKDPIQIIGSFNDISDAIQYPFDNWFRFNIHSWPVLLRMAISCGWKPRSKLEEYLHNNGHIVTDEEAKELGSAIEKAIPDLSQESHPSIQTHYLFSRRELRFVNKHIEWSMEKATPDSFTMYFGGEVWKRKLKTFVEFCREGEFSID